MIAAPELVFDDYNVPIVVLRYEIDAEITCTLFSANDVQLQIEGVIQDIDVLFQPSCEV